MLHPRVNRQAVRTPGMLNNSRGWHDSCIPALGVHGPGEQIALVISPIRIIP